MKTPLQVIEQIVKDYPNDMELGGKIRQYIKELTDTNREQTMKNQHEYYSQWRKENG